MENNIEINSEKWLNLDNLMNEEWKDIPNYEGLYKISNYGRVKSLQRKITCNIKNVKIRTKKQQILKCSFTKTGYYKVELTFNNKAKSFKIHRLIAQAFIPNPNNYPIINHKNGIKTDNRVENLEWCTYKENNVHALEMGLRKPTVKFGKENHFSKSIYMICPKTNKIIKQFGSLADAARFLNKNPKSMSHIAQQIRGERNIAYGYKWRYAK